MRWCCCSVYCRGLLRGCYSYHSMGSRGQWMQHHCTLVGSVPLLTRQGSPQHPCPQNAPQGMRQRSPGSALPVLRPTSGQVPGAWLGACCTHTHTHTCMWSQHQFVQYSTSIGGKALTSAVAAIQGLMRVPIGHLLDAPQPGEGLEGGGAPRSDVRATKITHQASRQFVWTVQHAR